MRCSGRPRSATTSRTMSRSLVAVHLDLDEPVDLAGRAGRGRPALDDEPSRSGPTSRVSTPVRSSSEPVAPDTTRRPASSITTWSQTCCTSSRRWVASSTEMPNVPRRATRASISSRPSGSRPAVGSSSSTSSGSPTSAWASLVRWRMPVEKPPMGRNRASSRPTRSSTSDARWRAARGGQAAQLAEGADDVGGASGRAGGSRARACSRAAAAHPDGVARPRRCRTPRCSPVARVAAARASSGTAWSCPRRWPRRGRRCPRGTSTSRWSVAVTDGYRLVRPRGAQQRRLGHRRSRSVQSGRRARASVVWRAPRWLTPGLKSITEATGAGGGAGEPAASGGTIVGGPPRRLVGAVLVASSIGAGRPTPSAATPAAGLRPGPGHAGA